MAAPTETLLLARDVGLALGIVVAIFFFAYLYTGNWPPVVVIESGSMEHVDDDSTTRLGTIDTGDLVLAKQVGDRYDVVTYLEGLDNGYETYSMAGDVIIYDKNGKGGTPVIHRAMAWVEVLPNGSYYVPELNVYFDKYAGVSIAAINAVEIGKWQDDSGRGRLLWSGFLTKGDNGLTNPHPDQQNLLRDINGDPVQPVKPEFILGKGRGELPWMGMLKLCLTGQDGCDSAPSGQKTMMFFVIGAIVSGLLLLTFLPSLLPAPEEEEPTKQKRQPAAATAKNMPGSASAQKKQGSGPPKKKGPGG